jgi:hypothetical protein
VEDAAHLIAANHTLHCAGVGVSTLGQQVFDGIHKQYVLLLSTSTYFILFDRHVVYAGCLVLGTMTRLL